MNRNLVDSQKTKRETYIQGLIEVKKLTVSRNWELKGRCKRKVVKYFVVSEKHA